jgi:uncharacterized protein
MREPYQSLLPKLEAAVQRLLEGHWESHGWDHTLRVRQNAAHLARVEKGDDAVVAYAALLHDIGRAQEDHAAGRGCHAELGAGQVPQILREIGVQDENFIRHVQDCVRTHRYRRRTRSRPATLEARIVFDADKLDSIGAIGIGRAFHFAGQIGAQVHNSEPEALASNPYGPGDTAHREFLVKLRDIRETMLTAEGRRLAEARHRFMCEFFQRLNREAAGEV